MRERERESCPMGQKQDGGGDERRVLQRRSISPQMSQSANSICMNVSSTTSRARSTSPLGRHTIDDHASTAPRVTARVLSVGTQWMACSCPCRLHARQMERDHTGRCPCVGITKYLLPRRRVSSSHKPDREKIRLKQC